MFSEKGWGNGEFPEFGYKAGKNMLSQEGKGDQHERQNFWCASENRAKLYAPDRDSPGCGPFAWNRKFADKRNDDRDLQSDGHPGRRNDFKCAIYHYDEGGECDF